MKHYRFIIASMFALSSTAAVADDANAQRALQKAQFMLRQVTTEKTELETQIAALKQQVDKLTQELSTTKSSAQSSQQKTEEKFSSAIAQWKQRDTEVSSALSENRNLLQLEQQKNKQLEARLSKESQNFSICFDNNKKLYGINQEILTRYENKGIGAALAQKEPFTGIKQVEIENLVQDYRYQLDDLKLQPVTNDAASNSLPNN